MVVSAESTAGKNLITSCNLWKETATAFSLTKTNWTPSGRYAQKICKLDLVTHLKNKEEDQWAVQMQIKRKLMQLYLTCHLTYKIINWSVKVGKCAIEYTWWEQQRSGNKRLAPSGTMISSKMSLSDNSNVSEDEEDEEVCAQSHEFIQYWNKAKASAKQHPSDFVIARLFFMSRQEKN